MINKALLFRFESQTDEDTMDTFLEDLSAGRLLGKRPRGRGSASARMALANSAW